MDCIILDIRKIRKLIKIITMTRKELLRLHRVMIMSQVKILTVAMKLHAIVLQLVVEGARMQEKMRR